VTVQRSLVLNAPEPGWAAGVYDALAPGAYLVVLTTDEGAGIEARFASFEVRDTLLVLSPGPRVRYAFLFRKALTAGTVVDQLVVTRTGAMNTGACRVAYRDDADMTPTVGRGAGGLNPGAGANFPPHKKNWGVWTVNATGRWPTNVVFVHAAECERLGTRKVAGHKGYPNGPGGSSAQFSQKGTKTSRTGAWAGHADAAGLETVDAWVCAADCAVGLLDAQSGIRPSTLTGRADPRQLHANPGDNGGASLFGGGNSNVYADSGGASRFFPQFRDDASLLAWFDRLLSP
jgi:hypothetical protein